MKKIGLSFIVTLLIFSCTKEDDGHIFSESPDERLNKALLAYQTQLTGATNGWKAYIYPKAGGTYFFYFKFNDQNRVKMYSTFDSVSAVTPQESSYRLKALQQPSLIFDTYSYVHVLADPNPNVNGGTTGVGLQSDFEFYFDISSADTINLVGRVNGSKAVLIKATQQEAASYDNKELGKGFLILNLGKYLNYFKRITIGATDYELNVNGTDRIITFSWLDPSGNTLTFSTAYYYSETGINFVTPFTSGSQTINGLTDIIWNATNTTLSFSINGTPVTVIGLGQPLKVDLDAPRRWRQYAIDNNNSFWASPLGWHDNGVDDVLNLSSNIPAYNIVIYGPSGFGGWTAGDLCGVLYQQGNGATTASYLAPPAISNGIIKFRWVLSGVGFGSPLPPAAANLVYGPTNSIRSYLTDTDGFYLVQTGPESYDMVEATEGKIWISWFW